MAVPTVVYILDPLDPGNQILASVKGTKPLLLANREQLGPAETTSFRKNS